MTELAAVQRSGLIKDIQLASHLLSLTESFCASLVAPLRWKRSPGIM